MIDFLQVLYISQNRLTSLDGIEQFPSLITLSANHNPLSNFEILNALRTTNPVLRHVSFVGCPMSKLPNYKNHVIQRIPSLQTLDGQKIEAEERDVANQSIEKERSVMAILIHNDALLHKMVCPLSCALF